MPLSNILKFYHELRTDVYSYLAENPDNPLFFRMCEKPIYPDSFALIFQIVKGIRFGENPCHGSYDYSTREIFLDNELVGLERDVVLAHELVHVHYGRESKDMGLIEGRLKIFRNAIVEMFARNITATPLFRNRMLKEAGLSGKDTSIPGYMDDRRYLPRKMRKSVLRVQDLLPRIPVKSG